MTRKNLLSALAGIVFCLSCGDKNMSWERRLIFDEKYMHTFSLAITEGGRGFLGASIMSEAIFVEKPSVEKALAMTTALIQETRDDWVSRKEAYRTTGEINSLVHLDSGHLLAVNSHPDLETVKESMHFIKWDGQSWKDVSSLSVRAVRVWSNGGPILFSAGYPEKGFDSLLLHASFDEAVTWQAINLAGVDPLDTSHDEQVWLDRGGFLYTFNGRNLESFDLPRWKENPGWKTVQPLPRTSSPSVFPVTRSGFIRWGGAPIVASPFGRCRTPAPRSWFPPKACRIH
jgi:hypothetical protein